MYNRLDSIPACDRQTDRQTNRRTSCYGIVRAMHTRRAVKILLKKYFQFAEVLFFLLKSVSFLAHFKQVYQRRHESRR